MSKGRYNRHSNHCQEAAGAKLPFSNTSKLTATLLLVLLAVCMNSQPSLASRGDDIPDRLFEGQTAPQQLASSKVVHDRMIPVPMEEVFFPTNFDGQSKVLNIDTTVNMTIAINQFYYNPKWRGEYWVPFDQVDLIERASRLMSTWKEYDEANQYKVLNKVNIFFERYSGFGP